MAGGTALEEFFRLYGDTDGDADVDTSDRPVFLSALSSRSGEPDYLPYLDFNDDGRIGRQDRAAFHTRLNHSL